MSRQLRCCRCGCNTFRKVQESIIELFAWDEGNEIYAREERVEGSPSVSSFVCERCGSAAHWRSTAFKADELAPASCLTDTWGC